LKCKGKRVMKNQQEKKEEKKAFQVAKHFIFSSL
jgi:hypothetical protein